MPPSQKNDKEKKGKFAKKLENLHKAGGKIKRRFSAAKQQLGTAKLRLKTSAANFSAKIKNINQPRPAHPNPCQKE